MADVVAPEVRSRMMAGIRGKDTKPELIVRSGLHKAGFRFRLHDRSLPGSPDLVFRQHRAVIFVHGCFWHGHDCHLFKLPSTRTEFWTTKIARNRAIDRSSAVTLAMGGWRICYVWECAMKGKYRLSGDALVAVISEWLRGNRAQLEIRGLTIDRNS